MRSISSAGRRRPVRPIALALLAVLLACGLATVPAHAATPPPSGGPSGTPTLDQVFSALGVAQEPTDYVFLVDTSASMAGNNYDQVLSILRTYVASLRPTDHVAIIGFDSVPSPVYTGPASGAAVGVSRLPDVPTGSATDIGAAIQYAVSDEELGRDGASPTAAVALLTDGAHDPPPGSDFPTDSGPAWDATARQASALDRPVAAYAFALGSDISGARLLQQVFPKTVVPRLPASQLPDYLGRIRKQVEVTAAVDLVRKDLAGGVDVSWSPAPSDLSLPGGHRTLTLRLRSTTSKLALTVSNLRVGGTGVTVDDTSLPRTIALAPGATWSGSVRVTLPAATGFHLGTRTYPVRGELTVTAAVDTPWRPVINRDLDLSLSLHQVAATTDLVGAARRGVPWSTVALAIAAITAVLVLLLMLWVIRYPLLAGVVRAETPDGRSSARSLGRRRRVPIGRRFWGLRTEGKGRVYGRRTKTGPPVVWVRFRAPNHSRAATQPLYPGTRVELGGTYFVLTDAGPLPPPPGQYGGSGTQAWSSGHPPARTTENVHGDQGDSTRALLPRLAALQPPSAPQRPPMPPPPDHGDAGTGR